MNEKTLRLLEFDALREQTAARALSGEAARLIREDLPWTDAGELRELKARVGTILQRMREGTGEPRETLPEIGPLLPRLETPGAALEIDELYALGLFIHRGAALARWLPPPPPPPEGALMGGAKDELGAAQVKGPPGPPPPEGVLMVCAKDEPGAAQLKGPPGPPKGALLGGAKDEPGAAQLKGPLGPPLGVEQEIFRVIDREGKLRELPEFREIQNRIRRLNRDLESLGSRYSAGEETRHMLQSSVPSQRDGRLVLAVKANFRGRIRGIVHEVSATGQTVFVEPGEAVEINNDLLIEQRRLDAEVRRVLRELSARIAAFRDDLGRFHRDILLVECLRARARYGLETGGIFAEEDSGGGSLPLAPVLHSGRNVRASSATPPSVCPSATPSAGLCPATPRRGAERPPGPPGLPIILKKARHPLLGAGAVPLDLEMEARVRTVIITGPNTGGKTVALKTLGLLALMNQFGLPLPVEEGTVLPVFDGVYADIGDEQSLSQSLSTFSAHMTNIASIMEAATEHSLVLLDELGSGTDPEEGSAIAMAILDHLIDTGVRSLITTHQGILKNYGYTREGVENASMEFDRRTLSPTFRIIMGIPGESRAVEIAARNGLPPALVERARHYLADGRSDVSALITGLKEKHRELEAAAQAGREEESRLREERREADLKELRLRQRELVLRQEGIGSLRRLLEESRKTLENLVREVREGELNREKTLRVKEFLKGLAGTVAAGEAELEGEENALAEDRRRAEEAAQSAARDAEAPSRRTGRGKGGGGTRPEAPVLGPGQAVLAGERKRRGRVLRADRKGFWVVEIGSLKMTLPEKDLVPLNESGEERRPLIAPADLAAAPAPRFELNLRGQRMEEALENLRRQIDGAVLTGLREFAVVHGKGDGILQRAVHEFLKAQPEVADYYFSRPELGGFGRTEVILKD